LQRERRRLLTRIDNDSLIWLTVNPSSRHTLRHCRWICPLWARERDLQEATASQVVISQCCYIFCNAWMEAIAI
jgi:hypothetical protein